MEESKGIKMFNLSNKLYELLDNTIPDHKSKGKITYHKINGLVIPFGPDWQNIGINLSGGADSACLAMMLATIIKENNYPCKIHTLTFLRCWNTRPWQGPVGIQVYEKLKTMFPDIVVARHENYIPPELEYGVIGPIINGRSGDQIEGRSFNDYISWKHKFDAVFNATSKNPNEEDGFDNRLKDRDKSPEDGELQDVVIYNKGSKTYLLHPFRFVQKDWIVAQFYLHNATELFETTRSCEGDINDGQAKEVLPNGLDDYKPGMYIPLCKYCFWCLERNWAVGKLNETMEKIKHV